MGFELLDEKLTEQRRSREEARTGVIRRVERALEFLAAQYEIPEAYLFGSLVRPGRFTDSSDVDIGIPNLGPDYWRAAAELSTAVGREVHLVELGTSRFAERIRKEGIRWTPPH